MLLVRIERVGSYLLRWSQCEVFSWYLWGQKELRTEFLINCFLFLDEWVKLFTDSSWKCHPEYQTVCALLINVQDTAPVSREL